MEKIRVCNQALSLLGLDNINSFEDDDLRARACKNVFDSVFVNCISITNWSFATMIRRLSQIPCMLPNYSFCYELPYNIIRILKVHSQMYEFKIIQNNIFTDSDLIILEYLSYEDNLKPPVHFYQYLKYCLAVELETILCNDKGLRDRLYNEMLRAEVTARQLETPYHNITMVSETPLQIKIRDL